MDVFPKFIIEAGALIIGKVSYHHQLVTNKADVKGGGWFKYGKEDRHIIFYGDSQDFGKAKLEDIKPCIESGQVYSSRSKHRQIAYNFQYSYDTGAEIISITPGRTNTSAL